MDGYMRSGRMAGRCWRRCIVVGPLKGPVYAALLTAGLPLVIELPDSGIRAHSTALPGPRFLSLVELFASDSLAPSINRTHC
jgi:hypothetical protein